MNQVAILIDFDNIFPLPMNSYTCMDLHRTISLAISIARAAVFDVDKVVVRLYGGWYEGNRLTARASTLSSMLPMLNTIFPIIEPPRVIIQGRVELATQLNGHSYVWYNSYREHFGLPKLRVNTSAIGDICEANKNTCPVKILKKFTDKKRRVCENTGCNTIHGSVFFERTQKFVDTMIACDIITLSSDPEVAAVYLMSDDEDHFPALATAHDLVSTRARLGLMMLNDLNVANYAELLSPFEIEVSNIPLIA